MSTSSGRTGSCERCGHFFDGHAHACDSKCKKCKKLFEICQVATHRGWRICFIPCKCGAQYYPDKARAAVPLASHEYQPNHPGYRALTPDEDEYDTTIDEASPSISQGGGNAGHARTDSTDSEDPLAWSMERYQRETTGKIDGLVETLRETHIGESSTPAWSEWAWNAERNQWGRFRTSQGEYEYDWRDPEASTSSTSNQEGSVSAWSEWAWNAERNQWGRYRMSQGDYVYEWRKPEPLEKGKEQGHGKGSGSGKGKGKGKSRG
jgi:hypothetical protein